MDVMQSRDEEAEGICRWGAARSAVLVVIPIVGTVALMANYVYMVVRLGEAYGVKASTSAVRGFVAAFAGTVAGATALTLVPFAVLQVPIAVSVTYGIGRAAQAWIKDGMPAEFERYKKIFENAMDYAKKNISMFKNDPRKNEPLGDEKKKF